MNNFWGSGNQVNLAMLRHTRVYVRVYLSSFTYFVGVVGTRRMCSSRDLHNICQYITYPDHDRVYRACVYTCSTDDCNTGTIPTISVVAVLISFLCVSICLYWVTVTTCGAYTSLGLCYHSTTRSLFTSCTLRIPHVHHLVLYLYYFCTTYSSR